MYFLVFSSSFGVVLKVINSQEMRSSRIDFEMSNASGNLGMWIAKGC